MYHLITISINKVILNIETLTHHKYLVLINGSPGKCTLKGVYRVVEEGKVGKIMNIQYPKDRDWYGFVKGEGDEKNIIFSLVSF